MDDERYQGDPIVVDEGDPSTWQLEGAVAPVLFENMSNVTPDWNRLANTLQSSRMRLSVKCVYVEATSRMTEAQLLPLFPEVDTVDVLNRGVTDLSTLLQLPKLRKLTLLGQWSRSCSLAFLGELPLKELCLRASGRSDIEQVDKCRQLDSLEIHSYPFDDLSHLGNVRAGLLRIANSKIVRAVGGATRGTTKFARCPRLTDLSNLATTYVELSDCGNVNLNTLPEVHGLRVVWICGGRGIDDWGFLRTCDTLEHLIVSGAQVTADDWSPISDASSLELVWLGYPVSDRAIERFGQANPHLVITNGHACMAEGQRCDDTVYFDLQEKLRKRRRQMKSS